MMLRKVSFLVLMNAQKYVTSLLKERRIKDLTNKYVNIRSSKTTHKNDSLHDNFVIVPIDKVNDDITIVFK